MRIATLAAAVALLLAGCQTASVDEISAQIIRPEIAVYQISNQPIAAQHVSGIGSVQLRLRVINKSAEQLTLDRVQLESVGFGAFTLRSSTQNVSRRVEPDQFANVDFWVPVEFQDTIIGNNGPVTVRGIAYFSSAVGRFQQVFVQQLNDQSTRGGGLD
jgi:hypothetical protein